MKLFATGFTTILLFAFSSAMEDDVKSLLTRQLDENVKKVSASLDSSIGDRSLNDLCQPILSTLQEDHLTCSCTSEGLVITTNCDLKMDFCEEKDGKKVCFGEGSKVLGINLVVTGPMSFDGDAETCLLFKEVSEKPELDGKEVCLKMPNIDVASLLAGNGGGNSKLPFADCEVTFTGKTCTCEVCPVKKAMKIDCDSKSISTCSSEIAAEAEDPQSFVLAVASSVSGTNIGGTGAPTSAPTDPPTAPPTAPPTDAPTSDSKILSVSGILGLVSIGSSMLV